MDYQSIKPTSTRGQLLAMVGWLCAVCGMLRCVFTVQRYECFFCNTMIFFFWEEGEGGVAEIGDTKDVVLLLTVFLFPSIDNAITDFVLLFIQHRWNKTSFIYIAQTVH